MTHVAQFAFYFLAHVGWNTTNLRKVKKERAAKGDSYGNSLITTILDLPSLRFNRLGIPGSFLLADFCRRGDGEATAAATAPAG